MSHTPQVTDTNHNSHIKANLRGHQMSCSQCAHVQCACRVVSGPVALCVGHVSVDLSVQSSIMEWMSLVAEKLNSSSGEDAIHKQRSYTQEAHVHQHTHTHTHTHTHHTQCPRLSTAPVLPCTSIFYLTVRPSTLQLYNAFSFNPFPLVNQLPSSLHRTSMKTQTWNPPTAVEEEGRSGPDSHLTEM